MHHLSTSLKTLQEKINIIKALKAPPMDPENLKIQIFGTNKNMILNINKLHEAISFEDIDSEDKKKPEESKRKDKPKLDIDLTVDDHKHLHQMLKGFKVTENEDGTLQKHAMIQILKFIADFAKIKNSKITKDAQEIRLEHYGVDDIKYINSIRSTLIEEEANYDYCQKAVFHKLYVQEETFRYTEQVLMSNPLIKLELMKDNINSESNEVDIPESLDRETTIEIIRKANDISIAKYKVLHPDIVKIDEKLTPIIISCLSHDYIFDVYGYNEEVFKAAIKKYKVFDDQELSFYIYSKQIELAKLLANQ